MSVLAYSELLKRITGITEQELSEPFRILGRNNTTPLRMRAIKQLALNESISLGKLLEQMNCHKGGGSYITINRYFSLLEKEGLLEKKIENNASLWRFSQKGELLKKYILSG